jgi:hypothetical protein
MHPGIPSFHDVFRRLLTEDSNFTTFSYLLRISDRDSNESFPTFAVHCVIDFLILDASTTHGLGRELPYTLHGLHLPRTARLLYHW